MNEPENAVKKLEEWLKPQCHQGKRVVFIYPPQVQEELGISQAVFWYAIFILKERQIIGFEEKGYLGVHPAAIMIEDVA